MKRMHAIRGVLAMLAVATVAFFGWRWTQSTTTVELPAIPLDGTDPEIVKAIRQEQDAVRQEPTSAKAWGRLGMTLLANKFADEATMPLQQAADREPTNPRWWYLTGIAWLGQNPDEAVERFRRAEQWSTDPEQRAAIQLRLAETLLANGHHAEAAQWFDRIPDGPLTPCVAYGRGVLAVGRGEWGAAKTHFLASQQSPYTQRKAALQLATIARRNGEPVRPTIDALAEDAPWPDPILEVCMALVVGRDHRLKHVTQWEQQGKGAQAIEELRAIVRDYPDATTHLALGITLGRQGQAAESEQQLRQCLKLEPQLVRAQYYLSLALFAQGEQAKQRGGDGKPYFEEAARWAKSATELAPHHGEAYFQWGLCEWSLNRRSTAIIAFRQTIATRPELVDGHYWLAKVLAADGQTREAKSHAERALSLAPDDARAKQLLETLKNATNP